MKIFGKSSNGQKTHQQETSGEMPTITLRFHPMPQGHSGKALGAGDATRGKRERGMKE
jgi:hypothetical protein